MGILIGKRYALRNGIVVKITQINYENKLISGVDSRKEGYVWNLDGEYSCKAKHDLDIVSEYIEKENKMEQNMCDFSTVKVGDKVWANHLGWTEVTELVEDEFQVEEGDWFCFDGKINKADHFPAAFWDIPNIIAPPAPKRKVKKIIKGWINIYKSGKVYFYKSKILADDSQSGNRIACIHINEEYEVEE